MSAPRHRQDLAHGDSRPQAPEPEEASRGDETTVVEAFERTVHVSDRPCGKRRNSRRRCPGRSLIVRSAVNATGVVPNRRADMPVHDVRNACVAAGVPSAAGLCQDGTMDRHTPQPDGNVRIESGEATARVVLSGALGVHDLPRLRTAIAGLPPADTVTFDLAEAVRIDTAIAWEIIATRAARPGSDVVGAARPVAQILTTVEEGLPKPDEDQTPPRGFRVWVAGIGESVAGIGAGVVAFIELLGLFVARLGRSIVRPSEFRLTALVHHCHAVGLQAVPIVALMAFLIGIVLAFQGAAQLREFGAEVFVVDLIAISILRELGILLTAIIVAGRTASAYTAAIGSMKMREEIDAMRTLGIDPAMALVVPRVLALVLMLPILGLIANVSGLIGGALLSWLELGISPAMFATRLVNETDVSHAFVGLSKAPVFAILIGIIGCQAGFSVGNTTESLGSQTSSAVVAAIFAVILADAAFSIFYEEIGL
jgi:phospholipid/cholesterol/gamma-HCH transport system permease protein